MRKLRLFAMAAFAAFCMSATAQVTYGNDYQYQPEKKSSYAGDNEAFSTLYVQFNPSTIKTKSHGSSDSESCTAFSLGYSYALPLGDIPLYLEFGGAVQWFFKSTDYTDYDPYSGATINEKQKFNMIALKIPVNVMYSFNVSESFSIQPYAGIYARVNILAKTKVGDESADMFSKDDMGDIAWKRFQVGWNAGCKFRIAQKLTIGAGYYMDLIKIMSYNEHKTHFQGFDITLGLNF